MEIMFRQKLPVEFLFKVSDGIIKARDKDLGAKRLQVCTYHEHAQNDTTIKVSREKTKVVKNRKRDDLKDDSEIEISDG